MEYTPQVRVSKEDLLALNDLAREMSIMDYMSKVIHEHIAAQQSGQADGALVCPICKSSDLVTGLCKVHGVKAQRRR